jgi:hypothetical protein
MLPFHHTFAAMLKDSGTSLTASSPNLFSMSASIFSRNVTTSRVLYDPRRTGNMEFVKNCKHEEQALINVKDLQSNNPAGALHYF